MEDKKIDEKDLLDELQKEANKLLAYFIKEQIKEKILYGRSSFDIELY